MGQAQVVPLSGIVGGERTDGHGTPLVIEGDGCRGHPRATGLGAATIGHILQPKQAAWLAWGHASEWIG